MESAVYCGVGIKEFWDLTIKEVSILIEAYNKHQKEQLQWEAQLCYDNAMLIGRTTAFIMSGGKDKIPQKYEVFPTLFEKPTPQQQDWRIAKERLMNFAKAHNQKRGETTQ
jgi:hypothetical protein